MYSVCSAVCTLHRSLCPVRSGYNVQRVQRAQYVTRYIVHRVQRLPCNVCNVRRLQGPLRIRVQYVACTPRGATRTPRGTTRRPRGTTRNHSESTRDHAMTTRDHAKATRRPRGTTGSVAEWTARCPKTIHLGWSAPLTVLFVKVLLEISQFALCNW